MMDTCSTTKENLRFKGDTRSCCTVDSVVVVRVETRRDLSILDIDLEKSRKPILDLKTFSS